MTNDECRPTDEPTVQSRPSTGSGRAEPVAARLSDPAEPRRGLTWLGGCAAAGAPFLVYLLTLVPTVVDGDAADLARQCYTLGLAYPPGYPVVGMLGKVFTTCVPVGPAGWRANVLAAVAAMATLLLGYALLRRWRVPILPAVLAMWVLGLSSLFWSQSLYINGFMVAGTVWVVGVLFLLDRWANAECRMGSAQPDECGVRSAECGVAEGGSGSCGEAAGSSFRTPHSAFRIPWGLVAGSAVCGFALGGHPSFALCVPVVPLIVVVRLRKEGLRRIAAGLLIAGAAGLAGCLPWLAYTSYYLVHQPDLQTGESFLRRLVTMLTAAEGRGDWGRYAELAYWKGMAARGAVHVTKTVAQFSPVGVGLGLVGAFVLWRRRPRSFLLIGVAYLMQTLFAVTLQNWHHFDVYRLTCQALWALWIGLGLGAAWGWARTGLGRVALTGTLAALTLGPPYAALLVAPPGDSEAKDPVRFIRPDWPFVTGPARANYEDALHALAKVQPDASLATTWGPFTTLQFLQHVEGYGRGVRLTPVGGSARELARQVRAVANAPHVYLYARDRGKAAKRRQDKEETAGSSKVLDELRRGFRVAEAFTGQDHTLYELVAAPPVKLGGDPGKR